MTIRLTVDDDRIGIVIGRLRVIDRFHFGTHPSKGLPVPGLAF